MLIAAAIGRYAEGSKLSGQLVRTTKDQRVRGCVLSCLLRFYTTQGCALHPLCVATHNRRV